MRQENEGIYCPDITSYLEMSHIAHTQKHKDFHIVSLAEFSHRRINKQKLPLKVSSRKLGFFQIVTSNNHDANLIVDGTKYNDMENEVRIIDLFVNSFDLCDLSLSVFKSKIRNPIFI